MKRCCALARRSRWYVSSAVVMGAVLGLGLTSPLLAQNPITDDFSPEGTSDLGFALIPIDATGGAQQPRFLGPATSGVAPRPFYPLDPLSINPPIADGTAMELGNLAGTLNGVAHVVPASATINDRDYSIEADVYIVTDASVRREVGLFVYQGDLSPNDRFPIKLFYNSHTSGTGPGFVTRVGTGAGIIHANPALPGNQWVKMKIDIRTLETTSRASVFVDWTGDGVDDLGTAGKDLSFPLTSGRPGCYVVTNNPQDFAGLVNQPHYFDNVVITFFSRIVGQPQDTAVPSGLDATFTVTATGTGTLSYQWRRDGQELPGETGTTLVVPDVSVLDDGATFEVLVTDDIGSTLSRAATLTVLPPPCSDPFADADGDTDVDADDFGVFQACYTGSTGAGFDPDKCDCFDRDFDNDIDAADFDAFVACASRANVPAAITCDDFPTGNVVINEFVYDDSGTDEREFIELYNAGPNPVDISGWTVRASDNALPPADDNPDYTVSGAPGSGTVILPPGGFYVMGSGSVANVNQIIGTIDLFENDNEVIELLDGNGLVKDVVVYERYLGSVAVNASEGAIWGESFSVDGTFQSWSRWIDGRDTNDNGRDFGLRPMTPGASNHAAHTVVSAFVPPDVDGGAIGTPVPGMTGSFVGALIIDPTVADANNPNAIPASPQGGNAIIAWDPAGGGNSVHLDSYMTGDGSFDMWVYFDTSSITVAGAESTLFGLMGTTGTYNGVLANLPDPDANFRGDVVTGNSSTGLAWVFNKNNAGDNRKLFLVDAHAGGDSSPGPNTPAAWTVHATIDMTAVPSGWYRLALAYTSATGAVSATFDTQTFNFSTSPGLVGTFYVGYQETLAGVPTTLRPPTFDLRP